LTRDVIGLFSAVIVLAGITFAIANGGGSAQLLGAIGSSFSNIVGTATHPGVYPGSNGVTG
jgi:hypothetical protein